MSRKRRSNMPGMVFHVTSRTNGKEHWFDATMRSHIVSIFAACFRLSEAQLLAYVVMPNHYHLVIRQGSTSLDRLMQSINRRIALSVQRHLGRTGHIFERRYRERPCGDAEYLRNTIVYTHLNPVRAGLCSDPLEYIWSSHANYGGMTAVLLDSHALQPQLAPALELFAHKNVRTKASAHASYDRFIKWRRECDLLNEDAGRPEPPLCTEGDAFWALHFGNASYSAVAFTLACSRPDLRDLVRDSLREVSPLLTLDHLRLRCATSMMVSARRSIIKRALLAGFRGAVIARYLNVSEATVSCVSRSLLPAAKSTFPGYLKRPSLKV